MVRSAAGFTNMILKDESKAPPQDFAGGLEMGVGVRKSNNARFLSLRG